MSVYKVMTEDHDIVHIEAENFSRALVVWHAWARAEWGEDYSETDQPASMELISDEIVWRDGAMDTDEKEMERLTKSNSILAMAFNLAAGLASTLPQYADKHPQSVADEIMAQAEKAYVDCDCLKEQEKP
jgi:hypothetical protein